MIAYICINSKYNYNILTMLLLITFPNLSASIINHSINKSDVFKKLDIHNDHQYFIKQFCKEVPNEVEVELKNNSIYSRVYFLLDQLEEILKNPDSQMIIDYEYIHYRRRWFLGSPFLKTILQRERLESHGGGRHEVGGRDAS